MQLTAKFVNSACALKLFAVCQSVSSSIILGVFGVNEFFMQSKIKFGSDMAQNSKREQLFFVKLYS
jgi:hypothetical protein